jgi:GTP-binding protein EngB required for normal cell division/Tfp pilus assembly protein PilF
VLLSLSQVLLELGHQEEARLAAQRLLQESPGDAEARCALARGLLANGRAEEANQELLRALEADPNLREAHQLLAQVHLAVGNPEAALRHLRTAQSLGTEAQSLGTEILRQILKIELEIDTDPDTLRAMRTDAEALLRTEPADPLGLACLALTSLDQPQRARELAQQALTRQETYAGRMALGQCHLALGDAESASIALRAALRLDPGGQRARSLLTDAYEQLSGGPVDRTEIDFYPALRTLHQLLISLPPMADQGTEVARIQEVFDRPLLITVMGEFNSGKSTFVNALIGEKIAPMGVTPTTATINILKYGEHRGARVLWRDDREDELAWEAVGAFLRGLDRKEAQQIRLVELLYPSEELLRVNVVDTPGLNSMMAEHEQTAREYLSQADAVVWLFSAHQAGKQTEQQALELLRRHRLKTVGVLNKVDRLTEEELEQVTRHLDKEFADLVEAVIPVAARPALEALAAGEEQLEQLEQSRFPELRRFLEQQLFARSRKIKREVCQRRLDRVLSEVTSRTGRILEGADRAMECIDQLRTTVQRAQQDPGLLDQERPQLRQALQKVYRQGAAEVLDFVRPRRWVFGEHRATPADRDFLMELLLSGLTKMGEASAARVVEHFSGFTRQLREPLDLAFQPEALSQLQTWLDPLDQLVGERVTLLHQQVYARHHAFTRGFLRGGRVDGFFERTLPRLELAEDAIHDALVADSVDLEEELLLPLSDWQRETMEQLSQRLALLRNEVDLFRLEQDRRVLVPVLALQKNLALSEAQPEARP